MNLISDLKHLQLRNERLHFIFDIYHGLAIRLGQDFFKLCVIYQFSQSGASYWLELVFGFVLRLAQSTFYNAVYVGIARL